MRVFLWAAVTLTGTALLSCGGDESPKPSVPRATGNIEGAVRLSGETVPEATRVTNTTDPEVCGRGHTLDDLVVSEETRGIRYAIAAVREMPAEAIPAFEPERVVIDNLNCRFDPHAVVATVGSTVEALNSVPLSESVGLI